ncbi:CobW C-terminal domain-containing protein [Streptomyces sp. NEAU-174]|uniref:CobW C-terminal domain-containing protein n=1 Tax=Streptomyces sp. NEAU-174 TaxID=3458254 RepID=UPI0040443985
MTPSSPWSTPRTCSGIWTRSSPRAWRTRPSSRSPSPTGSCSVGIDLTGELDEERLNRWPGTLLRTKGVDIFRSKGILALARAPKQYVFQGVHMLLVGEFGRDWHDGEQRRNRLVFIGRDLDREALERGFADCLATAGAAA